MTKPNELEKKLYEEYVRLGQKVYQEQIVEIEESIQKGRDLASKLELNEYPQLPDLNDFKASFDIPRKQASESGLLNLIKNNMYVIKHPNTVKTVLGLGAGVLAASIYTIEGWANTNPEYSLIVGTASLCSGLLGIVLEKNKPKFYDGKKLLSYNVSDMLMYTLPAVAVSAVALAVPEFGQEFAGLTVEQFAINTTLGAVIGGFSAISGSYLTERFLHGIVYHP